LPPFSLSLSFSSHLPIVHRGGSSAAHQSIAGITKKLSAATMSSLRDHDQPESEDEEDFNPAPADLSDEEAVRYDDEEDDEAPKRGSRKHSPARNGHDEDDDEDADGAVAKRDRGDDDEENDEEEDQDRDEEDEEEDDEDDEIQVRSILPYATRF
jgi:hypothetical protein